MSADTEYKKLLRHVLKHGKMRENRTNIRTLSCFGYQSRYDISKSFPLLTTKKVFWKGIVHELLWFLKGDTNVKYLQDNNVHIWDDWATKEECAKFGREEGELGPIYSALWRKWEAVDKTKHVWSEDVTDQFGGDKDGYEVKHIDQISRLIEGIKTNPNGRRHIITGWNPATCDEVSLPPCHTMYQFYVHDDGTLDCHLYQRSCDAFLGCAFNIASYSLLTYIIAEICGLKPGMFIHSFGDLHLYENSIEAAKEQLKRKPMKAPTVRFTKPITSIDNIKLEDIELVGYKSHGALKVEVAV